jgi:acyl-homoserine lactone acylase PvdQ
MRVLAMKILVGGALLALTAYGGTAQAPISSGAGSDLKALARQSLSKLDGEISAPGLREPVEVVRDKWGVPHI